MRNSIKRTIINIMVTTCSALMLSAVFALIFGVRSLPVLTFFEIFAANILIHLGLTLTKKLEFSYAIFEYLIDISYIIVVLVLFALFFNWFSTIPAWYFVIMAVAIYTFGVFLNIARIRKNADELNKLLKKYKDKNANTVT